MLLTDCEIHRLTGYKGKKLQSEWLTRNAIPFYVRADGKPMVLSSHLDSCSKPQTIATTLTMGDLFDKYMLEIAPLKSKCSFKNNVKEIATLRKAFGAAEPKAIRAVDIYKFIDARGEKTPVAANREKALLSHVFSKAIRWGIVTTNPCKEVCCLPEQKRNRYVTDDEFQAVRAFASPLLCNFMDFAYLTGLRKSDALKVRLVDIQPNGIHINVNKTGNQLIIECNPELRRCIARIKAISAPLNSPWLFCNRKGQAYTADGFSTLWQRMVKKALGLGIIEESFRIHDLRRKTASDAPNIEHARRLLSHSTQSTTAGYISGPQSVQPLNSSFCM